LNILRPATSTGRADVSVSRPTSICGDGAYGEPIARGPLWGDIVVTSAGILRGRWKVRSELTDGTSGAEILLHPKAHRRLSSSAAGGAPANGRTQRGTGASFLVSHRSQGLEGPTSVDPGVKAAFERAAVINLAESWAETSAAGGGPGSLSTVHCPRRVIRHP